MRAQTVVLPTSVSVMKVSTDSISVKELKSDSKTIIIICKLGLKKKPTFCDAT